METREQGANPDPGLLGCDREVFAQVWSRVSPGAGGMVEPTPLEPAEKPAGGTAAAPGSQAAPAAREMVSFGEDDGEGKRLQGLILACLNEAAVYQDLTRRSRRAKGDLTALARKKVHQAKRLSTAYFLMTGVRYWPNRAVSVNPPQSFFPVLRQRFLNEGRMAGELEQLSRAAAEPYLGELYLSLAEEAREMTHIIRLVVERES